MKRPVNPDCRDGKHAACNMDAWDDALDLPAHCTCECHYMTRPQ